MKKFQFFMVVMFVFGLASFALAQQKASPANLKVMDQNRAKSVIEDLKAGRYPVGSTSNAPAFTFMSTGDFSSGLTIYARNAEAIVGDAVLIGQKRYPGGEVQYMQPWYTIGGVPEGAVWYPMDESHKALWTEESGIAEYRLIVIQEGVSKVFQTERNYHNYDPTVRARTFIQDGVAVYDSQGNLKIYLFGFFLGDVRAVIRNENGWEWAIPVKGVSNNRFMTTLDMSTMPYFEKYGDNQVALVDGQGQSDQFTIRVRTIGSSHAREDAEILTEKIKRYQK